jgi:hypothetical protein
MSDMSIRRMPDKELQMQLWFMDELWLETWPPNKKELIRQNDMLSDWCKALLIMLHTERRITARLEGELARAREGATA